MWKGDSRGATVVASVTWHQQLSPHQTESISAVSKRVLPLAAAENIREADSTFGIAYLRKGKIVEETAGGCGNCKYKELSGPCAYGLRDRGGHNV